VVPASSPSTQGAPNQEIQGYLRSYFEGDTLGKMGSKGRSEYLLTISAVFSELSLSHLYFNLVNELGLVRSDLDSDYLIQ